MKRAALYLCGRIITGGSHLEAFEKLLPSEKDAEIISGFFDTDTDEFESDLEQDHFYNKEFYLVRHGQVEDPFDLDPKLGECGLEQIRRIASKFATANLEGFCGVTSPVRRCIETSLILQSTLNIKFEVIPDLAEKFEFEPETHHTDEWQEFLQTTKHALQQLPQKCIVVSHLGVICNLIRLALCEEKVQQVARKGIQPAAVTYINRQCVKCLGWADERVVSPS